MIRFPLGCRGRIARAAARVGGFLLLVGCAVSIPRLEMAPEFPADVYQAPDGSYRPSGLRVRVRPFAPASGRPATGAAAAAVLTRELTRQAIFDAVTLVDAHPRRELPPADLEVTGRVLHWFDGAENMAGRLETEIRVRDLRETPPRLLWWARHDAETRPAGDRDWVLLRLRVQGRPAAATGILLTETAQVYSRMMAAAGGCFPAPDRPRCPAVAATDPTPPITGR
jgi:hypothetical protein